MQSCNDSTLKASQRCGSANIQGWTQCSRLSEYIEKLCKTLVRQLKCTVSSNGSIGNKTDVWRLENWQAVHGAGGWVGSVKTHSTYRLATHELQDDKLSVRKATKPCKTHVFFTLGVLRSGLTPPVYPTCCNQCLCVHSNIITNTLSSMSRIIRFSFGPALLSH